MEKSGFVYIWYDRKHKRYYIGSHWGYEDDRYICSSTWMRNAYKRRPEDFKRRIIERTSDRTTLLEREARWLEQICEDEIGNRYYNLTNKIRGLWHVGEHATEIGSKISSSKKGRAGKSHSIETRLKMSESHIGKKHTKDTIAKLTGRVKSKETKIRMSESKIGITLPPRSAEHCTKTSEANIGKQQTADTRKKISDTLKGRSFSVEHRQKLRESRLGKTLNKESREKISLSLRDQWKNGVRNGPKNKSKSD